MKEGKGRKDKKREKKEKGNRGSKWQEKSREGSRQRASGAFEEGATASPGLGSDQVTGQAGGHQQHQRPGAPEEGL